MSNRKNKEQSVRQIDQNKSNKQTNSKQIKYLNFLWLGFKKMMKIQAKCEFKVNKYYRRNSSSENYE